MKCILIFGLTGSSKIYNTSNGKCNNYYEKKTSSNLILKLVVKVKYIWKFELNNMLNILLQIYK